ncbi:hypothetical protein KCP77_02600 [Salmonella enterica subsp. enterica]|nr:hypothetical protein KCP77_02600 [Salmonella enterica subsp. enterica]
MLFFAIHLAAGYSPRRWWVGNGSFDVGGVSSASQSSDTLSYAQSRRNQR